MIWLKTWLILIVLLDGTKAAAQTYNVTADAGFSVLPVPSLGLTAGYAFQPDVIAEASIARGLLGMYVFTVRSEVVGARVKKFWGDSFYTNTGLARRTIGIGFGPSSVIGTDVLDVEARLVSMVLDLSIGNSWRGEAWSFGIDWFGVLWPVAQLEGDDDIPTEKVSSSADRAKDRMFARIAEGRSYSVLRFAVGYAF